MITQQLLKEYTSYDPHSGELIWIKETPATGKCKTAARIRIGKRAGWINTHLQRRYAAILGRTYCTTHLIWLYQTGSLPEHGKVIDHINQDALDDRWENLRLADKSANGANRGKSKNNTSGYKGVFLHHTGRWLASVANVYLGLYDTKEEAASAYDNAAIKLFGEFSFTNKQELSA